MKAPRNNKKGITLVEVIVGVFVLSIFALGILSLLIYNNQAVADSTIQKVDSSTAAQKLDMVLAAISNSTGPDKDGDISEDSYLMVVNGNVDVNVNKICIDFGMTDASTWSVTANSDPANGDPLRGWYITVTYTVDRGNQNCVTQVKGYAAFAEGAFDE